LLHCPREHAYWATFTEDLDGHSPSPCPECHPYDDDDPEALVITAELPAVSMAEMLEGAR
jgi:hypothetical protein